MSVPKHRAMSILTRLLKGQDAGDGVGVLGPVSPKDKPLGARVPGGTHTTEGLVGRREALAGEGVGTDHLAWGDSLVPLEELAGNIENFVGYAAVPVGVIGPLRVNGAYARGDFYVPMATTEGALVASYHRGAYALSRAGGVSVVCLTESVGRAPCFEFENMAEAAGFLAWMLPRVDALQEVVDQTSSHCRLVDVRPTLGGKEVYLNFEYETGDASGQNMVTLATQAICRELVGGAPVKPVRWYLEGNLSGDKKATMLGFLYARGKKVVAEGRIPGDLLRRVVHVDPQRMVRYWQVSVLGGTQSGSIGVQGHFANALAAMFIACGQDAACVSEASVGLTRMDLTEDGGLYVSVSLPNLIVGTVGGGTHLPTARGCLEMMGCYGEGGARKFAEVCAAVCLAGEVSIIGALAAGHFADAHARYGRKRKKP